MEKIYLVKKDPTKDNPDNWIIMNRKRFENFLATPEGKARENDFGVLRGCSKKDKKIFIECGKDAVSQLKSENRREQYICSRNQNSGFTVLAFSELYDCDDNEDEIEVDVEDTTVNVEESALKAMEREAVREAVQRLTNKEQAIIETMFFGKTPKSEYQCAAILGLSYSTVHESKRRAFKKLKAFLELSNGSLIE